MSDKCKKCGSDDILTTFIEEGKHINSSALKKVENEFITSSEYDFYFSLKANKDHLNKHCRNCQYSWRENTVDSAK